MKPKINGYGILLVRGFQECWMALILYLYCECVVEFGKSGRA